MIVDNMTWNFDDDVWRKSSPFEDNFVFKTVIVIGYSIVFVISVFGNFLIVLVILSNKDMRSAVNFFLGNLAVADMFVGVFCVPPTLFKYLSQYWVTGRVMCKMHSFVQCLNYTCSIVILTVISLERYFIINHPLLKNRLSGVWVIRGAVVAAVWLASTAYSVPILVSFDLSTAFDFDEGSGWNVTRQFCVQSRTRPISYEAYAVVDFVFLYVLPLVLMAVVYVNISVVLWRSSRVAGGGGQRRGVGGKDPASKRRRKVYFPSCCSVPIVPCICCFCCRQCACAGPKTAVAPPSECPEQELVVLGNKNLRDEIRNDMKVNFPPLKTDQDGLYRSNESLSTSTSVATAPGGVIVGAADATRNKPPPDEEKTRESGLMLMSATHNGRAAAANRGPVSAGGDSSGTDRSARKASVALVHLRRRRVVRLLVAIVVCFAVCMLPHHVHVQYQLWGPPPARAGARYDHAFVTPITTLLFYTNSALNPILYAFISRKFRNAVRSFDWRRVLQVR